MYSLNTRVWAVALTALLSMPIAMSKDDDSPGVRDAAFGNGLNTAGAANHKILPGTIKARVGDVVDFGVSGFHFIRVYKPGVSDAQIRNNLIAAGCIIPPNGAQPTTCPPRVPDDAANTFFVGIDPVTGLSTPPPRAGGPPGATQSAAANRDERVSFSTPGKYLVICAITGHFIDGMYAYVVVKPAEHDDDD
jgi:plastocyanin